MHGVYVGVCRLMYLHEYRVCTRTSGVLLYLLFLWDCICHWNKVSLVASKSQWSLCACQAQHWGCTHRWPCPASFPGNWTQLRLPRVSHACKASTLVTEPSPQTLFSHLWSPLVLLSLGRRLGTSLGLLLELSQRQGVERLWEIVPGSRTLGHLSYVDFYGLIYDQANCTIWSSLPAKVQLGTKTNLLSESL